MGAEEKKAIFEISGKKPSFEKKVDFEILDTSAPVVCTFYPEYMRGPRVNKIIERPSLEFKGHENDVTILGFNENSELAPMQAVEPPTLCAQKRYFG